MSSSFSLFYSLYIKHINAFAYRIRLFMPGRRSAIYNRSLELTSEGSNVATPHKTAELQRVVNNSRAICSSIHVRAIRALIGNFSLFFSASTLVKTIYILLSFNATLECTPPPPKTSAGSGRARAHLAPFFPTTFSIFQLGIFPIDLRPGRRKACEY